MPLQHGHRASARHTVSHGRVVRPQLASVNCLDVHNHAACGRNQDFNVTCQSDDAVFCSRKKDSFQSYAQTEHYPALYASQVGIVRPQLKRVEDMDCLDVRDRVACGYTTGCFWSKDFNACQPYAHAVSAGHYFAPYASQVGIVRPQLKRVEDMDCLDVRDRVACGRTTGCFWSQDFNACQPYAHAVSAGHYFAPKK